MGKEHGIENLWKVMAFLVEAGNVAEHMKSKDTWVTKAMAMAPLINEIKDLVSLDIKALSEEYKDWDASERAELSKRVSDKYDIKNDVMESQIEGGLALAMEVADCVGKVTTFVKGLRK